MVFIPDQGMFAVAIFLCVEDLDHLNRQHDYQPIQSVLDVLKPKKYV